MRLFFDSFPLIHYTHAEMGKVLLLFSESRLIRLIGPLVPQSHGIQDEWYSASETLIGLWKRLSITSRGSRRIFGLYRDLHN